MSDSDVEVEVEVEAESAEAKPAPKKKHELPEGWATPSGLVHILKERNIVEDIKPQQIYGYVYHGKDFPSKQHTDGRFIVPIDDACEWLSLIHI